MSVLLMSVSCNIPQCHCHCYMHYTMGPKIGLVYQRTATQLSGFRIGTTMELFQEAGRTPSSLTVLGKQAWMRRLGHHRIGDDALSYTPVFLCTKESDCHCIVLYFRLLIDMVCQNA